MSLAMFITTFLSLVFPSIFQEIDIEKYRKEKFERDAESKDETNLHKFESPRVDYTKNSVYEQKQDSFKSPNPHTRIIDDNIV